LQGKLLCVSLVRADGGLRHFTGHVETFRHVKNDGGVAFYEAVLVPWMHYLRLRQNNRLFHKQTLQQQVSTILEDHAGVAHWDWKVTGEQPEFTMCTQWSEHDHNYVHARLEAAGYTYRWEHTEDGHQWVVWDDTRTVDPIDGVLPNIRFHTDAGSQEEHAVSQWSPRRQAVSAHTAVSGFDFKHPQPVMADVPSVNRQGDVPSLEVYQYEGHYGFKNQAGAEQLVRERIEAIEARGLQFDAEGNNACVKPGRWFKLVEHTGYSGEDAEFLILEAHHEASNNYLQDQETRAEYKNRFVCQRKSVPWRPGVGYHSTRSLILAPQTAIVVGPEDKGSLHVDEYGRVQVQFHWDRERSGSCWVRVATNWAGAENGLLSHPRVGSEVVVQWLDGNPDHPLITAGVHNQSYMPPWKLPDQHALAGLRSRELTPGGGNSAGGRSNHLILDDTADRIQVQLKSDHLTSQLSVGHITRIEDTAGRKDARGQGFELRTDGHGAIRAQQGLLVTTEARPNARAHITDMAETVQRLTDGQNLHDSMAQAATEAQAQQAGDQDEVVQVLKTQNEDIKGQGGDPQAGEFPEFKSPHLTLVSPAGLQTATQGSTHVVSTEHNAFTSGGHTSFTAGKSLLASVKNAVRLFAHKAGMKLVAATSDIDITALKDSINLLAKLNITHTANRITISAKEEVVVNGGGSYTKWASGGITHGTTGPWKVQAASFAHTAGAGMGSPSLPQTTQLQKGQVEVLDRYVKPTGLTRQGVDGGEFTLQDAEGGSHKGRLDGTGFNALAGIPMGMALVSYTKDPRDPWDEGSYLGQTEWPPKELAGGTAAGTGAAPAGATTSLAGKAGGAAAGVQQASAMAASAQQAATALQGIKGGGAQALVQSAGALANTPGLQGISSAALGKLEGVVPGATDAMAAAQSTQQAVSSLHGLSKLPAQGLASSGGALASVQKTAEATSAMTSLAGIPGSLPKSPAPVVPAVSTDKPRMPKPSLFA
jgi:type VI secretion system secreted protein VgrG